MNWMVMLLFSAATLAFSASGNPLSAMPTTQAQNEAQFELDTSADVAFPFFSPEGERPWEPGWNPKPVYPAQSTVAWQADAVFLIEGTEKLVWAVLNVDQKQHIAEYAYFVANSRVARIRVEVVPIGDKRCRVLVRYVATPLSEAGGVLIAENYSKEAFAQRIQGWQQRITAVLNTNAK